MNRTRFAFSIAVAALLVATPAMGQLPGFPVFGLSPADGDAATSVGAGYGRGLNDQSGKLDAIGVGAVRAMEMVSFGVFGSYDDEVAFAGSVAYHLPVDAPVNLSIQSGIGWMFTETVLNFPIGVVVSGSTQSGSVDIPWFVMPRVQITRVGGTASNTETDFGASGGVAIYTEGGWGLSLGLDWLIEQDILVPADNASRIGFSAAVVYRLP